MIIKWIKKFLARIRMPAEIKDWWYCGEWYMHGNKDKSPPYEGEFMIDPWRPSGVGCMFSNWDYDIDEVPGITINGFVGMYKVTGNRPPTNVWYDGAPWDNGYKIDLELSRVIPVEEIDLENWKENLGFE